MSEDTISRQAAIDICNNAIDLWHGQLGEGIVIAVKKKIKALPSAQPDSKELSFTQKKLDTISRQDAIRIVDGIDTWQAGWRGDAIESMKALPSAQPEPCVDTIDALDESIKHFDDMAEECRRNANIEQNDYMDMRDDAAEYRQLSIWLNELKWLRERFQSQPDLSEYSDKLWKAAYERGKAEAQAEIVRCKDCRFNTYSKKCLNPDSFFLVPADDFYCGYAERRTDGIR